MPLHLDYRPRTLKEVVGNETVVKQIQSVLSRKNKDFPRTWLFTGPSGCGKTTLARICASMMGVADADLREIDIAQMRGIDAAREIQEQMRLRPLSGELRAWILDEVHMGTKEFQNAMLKSLEDTPKHVVFFLCTTDPHKLLKTIVNRCKAGHFEVEPLKAKQIMGLLCDVVEGEKVDVPTDVLSQICEDAQGSARAALGVLDSIIDMDPKDMLAAAKKTAEEQRESIELCRALIDGKKWPAVAKIIAGMGEFEPERVRQHVLGYCNSILLKGDNARAWLVMDSFRDPLDRNGKAGITYQAYMAANAK